MDVRNCLFVVCLFSIMLGSCSVDAESDIKPPRTDYCEMLGRDIQGKQHGFLAGKYMYYIGGGSSVTWVTRENETLGFTHPMFRDGRARGYGIVTDQASGTGHDKWGWNFWMDVRCAYGTVIVDAKRYEYPAPKEMIWRPDRQVCTYEVAGVTIEETKFINADDVLCSIIKSSRPITLEFDGRSFYKRGNIATFDGDPAGVSHHQSSTASVEYDGEKNVLHIAEGGTIMTKTAWGDPARAGKIMYDGMHGVIGASEGFGESCKVEKDDKGVCRYTFQVDCDGDRPVVLTFAMDDDYSAAVARSKKLLGDPGKSLAEKTEYINDLLNEQIPYFRCSDDNAVKSYYYLWSLYFMYFTDTPEGWEKYPHTQTAVNNFMGLHLWDSWAYSAMGAWVADKWSWGHGNVLAWQAMVPYKSRNNAMPDNFGIAWYSPGVWMNFVGVTEFAWQQYEQSGDKKFLEEAYDQLFRKLYWTGPQAVGGIEINAGQALVKMAKELGRDEDVTHWQEFVDSKQPNYRKNQNRIADDDEYYWKDIWNLAALMSYSMPNGAAEKLVDRSVMDTEKGFVGPVALDVRPPTQPENGVFAASTISTWQVIEGMFRHDLNAEGIYCTLSHLNGMVKDYGFPIAPECWDPDYKPWGSMYYNWDGPMVCLMIQRLAGISYSIPEDRFTASDHLPDSWDYIETYTPVVVGGKTNWTKVRVERKAIDDGRFEKWVSVKNNVLGNLTITPWLEDRDVEGADGFNAKITDDGMSAYVFSGEGADKSVELLLGKRDREFNTLAYLLPHSCEFADSVTIKVDNLIDGTVIRYTTDGTEPRKDSTACPREITLTESTDLLIRAFSDDGTVYDTMKAEYIQIALSDAVEVGGLQPGLSYEYFEGTWNRLPDFDNLQAAAKGIAVDTEVSKFAKRKDNYAVRLKGYVQIPADDVYTIGLRCNDGARVFIDGQLVVELDGRRFEARGRTGIKGFKKGKHAIEIEYFQHEKRSTLEIAYSSNKIARKVFGAGHFFTDGAE